MMDTPAFDGKRFVRPAFQSIVFYISIILISSMAMVKPAQAEGTVNPSVTYWGGGNNIGFNCNGMASVSAIQDCEKAKREKWLADDHDWLVSRGAGNIVSCSAPALNDYGPTGNYVDHFSVTYYRIAYNCGYGYYCNYLTFCQLQPVVNYYIYTKPACPANSTTTTPPCTCKSGYEPDSTGTSCVSVTSCPANMSGSPCACIPGGYVPNPNGAGCVEEQYTLSEPQDQTRLPDVEPGSSRGVTARVTSVQTGQPKEGAVVRFRLDVDLTSGGHDHGETYGRRSRGTISGCVAESGGTPDTYDCTTGADGYTGFTFNAPDVSGTHTFTATCISHACSGSKTGKIDVKVDGLETIPASQFYALTEPDGRGGVKVIGDNGNHSGNHYLTSDAASQLWRLAATYYFKYRQDASVPLLHLNDASLMWGGRFDANGNWADPHAGHRKGTVIDIRANALPTAIPEGLFTDFEDMADKTKLANGTSAIAQLHHVGLPTQHYHVLLLGVDQ